MTGDSMTNAAATKSAAATPSAAVTERLAALTGTDAGDWFLVFKARYGMLETFAALAERTQRRSVVTQLLTCSTAVDPILVAGLSPVYAEVSPESLAIDPSRLVVSDDTAAVVIQHSFGIIDTSAARQVAAAARAQGALVCEDSAHCVGRMAKGADGAPLADVAFHSFGVEKMLPTKFGGAVWVNPGMEPLLRAAIVGRLAGLGGPGARLAFAARTYRYQLALLNRLPRAIAAPVRRLLVKARIFEPAVARIETEGRLPHKAHGASPWILTSVGLAMDSLSATEARRAMAAAVYVAEIGDRVQIPAGATWDQPLVNFPFLVPVGVDPDAVIAGLRATGVVAGSWYRPALFPGAADPSLYGYTPGADGHAVTEDVIARIVNLPTAVDPERARGIARQVVELIDSGRVART